MRIPMILLATTLLTACSGEGPTTVGGSAVASGSGTTTGTAPASTHSFIAPTEVKTYQGQGAGQAYTYDYTEILHYDKVPRRDAAGNIILDSLGFPTYLLDPNSRLLLNAGQTTQKYTAGTSSVRNPGVTVKYDPNNAQFTLTITQNASTDNITFQDPAHRTDFLNNQKPQAGVPDIRTVGVTRASPTLAINKLPIQYLEVDSGSSATVYDVSTFFYEQPGTNTQYVTYAGFVRNHFEKPVETILTDGPREQTTKVVQATKYERDAFVFGEQALTANVPKTGTASFTGNMIASIVNANVDVNRLTPSYFQWLVGTANVQVDFAKATVASALSGTVLALLPDSSPLLNPTNTASFTPLTTGIPIGALFTAHSTATIDLVNKGGFTGSFSDAQFAFGTTTLPVAIVGSTIDGGFYGPKGQEIGASFRIVGGIPDQRVDIVGAFTGR